MADKDFKNPLSKPDNEDSKNGDESPPHERLRTLLDEDAELHIVYLKMLFPDIAKHSLIDIYMANNQDLDDAVDMLTQLKNTSDVDESSKKPDTGNASKSASSEPNKSEAKTSAPSNTEASVKK